MSALVVVVGSGYSGSTLLAALLDAHPSIRSIGEWTGPSLRMPDPEAYPCSCGHPLGACPFYAAVFAEMGRAGHPLSASRWTLRWDQLGPRALRVPLGRSLGHAGLDDLRDRLVGLTPMGARWREIGGHHEAFASALRVVSGRPILVDASKDPRRVAMYTRTTSMRPIVVHLVRDALGFVASHRAHRGVPWRAVARQYNHMAAQVDRLRSWVPDERRVRVRYEDLVRDPAGVVSRIAVAAGASPVETLPPHVRSEHHLIGNRMRHQFDGTVHLDERWRERLAPEEQAGILRITRRWRQEFGYAAETG